VDVICVSACGHTGRTLGTLSAGLTRTFTTRKLAGDETVA
jgi:hypothetical protein